MARTLTLELPEELEDALRQAAASAGKSLEEWATAQLRLAAPAGVDHQRARDRLFSYAGVIDLGHPTGIDNEAIDADLAREAANPHEDES